MELWVFQGTWVVRSRQNAHATIFKLPREDAQWGLKRLEQFYDEAERLKMLNEMSAETDQRRKEMEKELFFDKWCSQKDAMVEVVSLLAHFPLERRQVPQFFHEVGRCLHAISYDCLKMFTEWALAYLPNQNAHEYAVQRDSCARFWGQLRPSTCADLSNIKFLREAIKEKELEILEVSGIAANDLKDEVLTLRELLRGSKSLRYLDTGDNMGGEPKTLNVRRFSTTDTSTFNGGEQLHPAVVKVGDLIQLQSPVSLQQGHPAWSMKNWAAVVQIDKFVPGITLARLEKLPQRLHHVRGQQKLVSQVTTLHMQ
jgi:hypothetical protein